MKRRLIRRRISHLAAIAGLAIPIQILLLPTVSSATPSSFVNWETAPIHPIELSSGGETLAVCNLPDGRLEVFNILDDLPIAATSIPVGIDPVSVRFRSDREVWVVNWISDSISVIDLQQQTVVATIDTADGPSDVVFAGSPPRAFVSCSPVNKVLVFDTESHERVGEIDINGDRPKALAVSPDGSTVYAAIFESGNATTILAPKFSVGFLPQGVVDFPQGPHGGVNPPPNLGTEIEPGINLAIESPPPKVSLIVRKSAKGRWLDDNHGDWTEFISGEKAALSGRPRGWDMPDRDLAIINAEDLSVEYATGLMNICTSVAVNPATGMVGVLGTEALNEIRFEPRLKSTFIRVHLALVDPPNGTKRIIDLNPHLDYTTLVLPESERAASIGDPRNLVWSADGSRGYVTGLGSNNLIVIQADGRRVEGGGVIPLGEGPTGMALDDPRRRLYALNRFSSSISVIDTDQESVVATIPFFDPTPLAIKRGRPHLYNTHQTSGLGQASCGSCHVDGRLDRLAWDLGAPEGDERLITLGEFSFSEFEPPEIHHFHPMKGPMVTQTLHDIAGHEPFHWRGDRLGLEEFDVTFEDLQGLKSIPSPEAMREFKAFLATIHFPPNRFRRIDNNLPGRIILDGHFSMGHESGGLAAGDPLPPGNPRRGLERFERPPFSGCNECHTLPTGLGPHMEFDGRRWQELPDGPNGEKHVSLIQLARADELPFKIAPLRSIQGKIGADFFHKESRAGFGFLHDGRVDTLSRFILDGFTFNDDQDVADMIAFMLAFNGSDLPEGRLNSTVNPPGLPGNDTHAAVGRQFTLVDSTIPTDLAAIVRLLDEPDTRIELVAHGVVHGEQRGWYYADPPTAMLADREGELISFEELTSMATGKRPLTVTVVPAGSGRRLGIDRDEDGFLNQSEIDLGFDPANPRSVPVNLPPIVRAPVAVTAFPGEVLRLNLDLEDGNDPGDDFRVAVGGESASEIVIDESTGELEWPIRTDVELGVHSLVVEATDTGSPPLSATVTIPVLIVDKIPELRFEGVSVEEENVFLDWQGVPGNAYRVQYKSALMEPKWRNLGVKTTSDRLEMRTVDRLRLDGRARFYRLMEVEE